MAQPARRDLLRAGEKGRQIILENYIKQHSLYKQESQGFGVRTIPRASIPPQATELRFTCTAMTRGRSELNLAHESRARLKSIEYFLNFRTKSHMLLETQPGVVSRSINQKVERVWWST